MKDARINWSEEVWALIERRLRSYELHKMLKIIRKRRERRVPLTPLSLFGNRELR